MPDKWDEEYFGDKRPCPFPRVDRPMSVEPMFGITKQEFLAALRNAEKAGMEMALDCQPATAEDPHESQYQHGRFDGVMDFARAIRAAKETTE